VNVITVGVNFSPKAYQDAEGRAVTVLPSPLLAVHEYAATADGRLLHRIEGRDRALVPPEGLDDYARLWPDCAPVVEALKASPAIPRVVYEGQAAIDKAQELAAIEGGGDDTVEGA